MAGCGALRAMLLWLDVACGCLCGHHLVGAAVWMIVGLEGCGRCGGAWPAPTLSGLHVPLREAKSWRCSPAAVEAHG